jgi:hypothetical protein
MKSVLTPTRLDLRRGSAGDQDLARLNNNSPSADHRFNPPRYILANEKHTEATMLPLRFVFLVLVMLSLTGCAGPQYAPYDHMTNSYG